MKANRAVRAATRTKPRIAPGWFDEPFERLRAALGGEVGVGDASSSFQGIASVRLGMGRQGVVRKGHRRSSSTWSRSLNLGCMGR